MWSIAGSTFERVFDLCSNGYKFSLGAYINELVVLGLIAISSKMISESTATDWLAVGEIAPALIRSLFLILSELIGASFFEAT